MADSKIEQASKRIKPPVGAVQWYADFFKLLERVRIDNVDNALLTTNKIVSSGSEYKVIGGLRFLHLIKDDGTVTEKMKGLYVVGTEYQKNFEQVIRDAYTVLFEKVVNLEQALPDDLINCFRISYELPPSTAEQGARIFVHLAQKAGIQLSKPITESISVSLEKAKTISQNIGKARASKRKQEPAQQSAEQAFQEQLPEGVLARFTLNGTGYVDIKDKDTFEIAKVYFKVLSKKLDIAEKESE